MACKNGNFPCSKCPLLSPYNKPFNAKCENFGIFSCTFTSAEEKFFNYISQIWMMVVMPMAIISCLVYHFTIPESIFHVQVFMLATRACKISANSLIMLTHTVHSVQFSRYTQRNDSMNQKAYSNGMESAKSWNLMHTHMCRVVQLILNAKITNKYSNFKAVSVPQHRLLLNGYANIDS